MLQLEAGYIYQRETACSYPIPILNTRHREPQVLRQLELADDAILHVLDTNVTSNDVGSASSGSGCQAKNTIGIEAIIQYLLTHGDE